MAAAADVAAQQCKPQTKGYSVLYGMQPAAGSSSSIHYWDRSASGLKVGIATQLSVYYDASSECIAGLRIMYGNKPGVSHLMGTERGPDFTERLLVLSPDESVNKVDVMFDKK